MFEFEASTFVLPIRVPCIFETSGDEQYLRTELPGRVFNVDLISLSEN